MARDVVNAQSGSAWSESEGDLGALQGASIELVACTMHSLLDALEDASLMQVNLTQERPTYL